MPDIEWKSPSKTHSTKGSAAWAEIAEALRARPGEWALVLPSASGSSVHAAAIKAGRIAAFRPAGSFDATARMTDEGRRDIYARYVGEATS